MKKFEEFITAIFVSSVIGLALSYATILLSFVSDLSFLESVAVYHFWIHVASFIKGIGQNEEE